MFALAPASLAAGAYDGTWNVNVNCPDSDDAKGYTWDFTAEVSGGHISGKWVSSHDSGNHVVMTGAIGASGDALLSFNGSTGPSEYAVHHLAPHSPLHFTASAHFDARSGSGSRNGHWRACSLAFSKI